MSRKSPLTPVERSLHATANAHTSWANTADRTARTANARRAFIEHFERQVDPDRILSPGERALRAEHLRKAHYARLALKSAQARRKAKEARQAKGTP